VAGQLLQHPESLIGRRFLASGKKDDRRKFCTGIAIIYYHCRFCGSALNLAYQLIPDAACVNKEGEDRVQLINQTIEGRERDGDG